MMKKVWAWWYRLAIPARGKYRQDHQEFRDIPHRLGAWIQLKQHETLSHKTTEKLLTVGH